MNCKSAYEILEMDGPAVDLKYLKKQYHKLALLYHPDKNGNTYESKLKFQTINEAYEFLLLSQEEVYWYPLGGRQQRWKGSVVHFDIW